MPMTRLPKVPRAPRRHKAEPLARHGVEALHVFDHDVQVGPNLGGGHGAVEAGYEVTDDVVSHLSPARFEGINPYCANTIDVAAVLNRPNPRPLRRPTRPGGT